MTPEDRKRIEEIRAELAGGRIDVFDAADDLRWLLDLVERQEAEPLPEVYAKASLALDGAAEWIENEGWANQAEWVTPEVMIWLLRSANAAVEGAHFSGERVAKREELGKTKDEIS